MTLWRSLLLAVPVAVVLLMAGEAAAPPVFGQQPLKWPIPQRVPGYAITSEPPFLVADRNRTVHAISSQLVKQTVAVVYRQWSLKDGWGDPVDVLLSPQGGQARASGAYLDSAGTLHVAYFGGNDVSFGMYYANAPAATAASAKNWSQPRLLDNAAGPLSQGILTGDDRGNLYVVYSGRLAGLGLYLAHSSDSGRTWSELVPIFLTYSIKHWVSAIQSVVDASGRLHVVWVVVNEAGTGDAVYYARLETDHVTWSHPMVLASKIDYDANMPAIAIQNEELIVVYHNGFPPTRWMRRSTDGGHSWTDPVKTFEGWVGTYGPVVMVEDSRQVLHMFLGNRTGNPATHGMWHSIWLGHRWSELEPIVSGPAVSSSQGEVAFDPCNPSAVVSQGNVALVTWRTDPGNDHNGVWYSATTLGTPELPLVPLPVPARTTIVAPTATPHSAPTPAPAQEPTSMPAVSTGQVFTGPTSSNEGFWFTTFGPVLLLISAAVAGRLWWSVRRY